MASFNIMVVIPLARILLMEEAKEELQHVDNGVSLYERLQKQGYY